MSRGNWKALGSTALPSLTKTERKRSHAELVKRAPSPAPQHVLRTSTSPTPSPRFATHDLQKPQPATAATAAAPTAAAAAATTRTRVRDELVLDCKTSVLWVSPRLAELQPHSRELDCLDVRHVEAVHQEVPATTSTSRQTYIQVLRDSSRGGKAAVGRPRRQYCCMVHTVWTYETLPEKRWP